MSAILLLLSLVVPAPIPPRPHSTRLRRSRRANLGAIDHSLDYLKQEKAKWISEHKCGSCHHAPMMVWAYGEAKRRGHKIDEQALATALDYTLAEDNRGGGLRQAKRQS